MQRMMRVSHWWQLLLRTIEVNVVFVFWFLRKLFFISWFFTLDAVEDATLPPTTLGTHDGVQTGNTLYPAAFDITEEGQEEPLSKSLYNFRIYHSPIFRLWWKRKCSFAACAKIRCLRCICLRITVCTYIPSAMLTRCWVQDAQKYN